MTIAGQWFRVYWMQGRDDGPDYEDSDCVEAASMERALAAWRKRHDHYKPEPVRVELLSRWPIRDMEAEP